MGCGFDINYWWLHDTHPELVTQMVWVEVDYDSVVDSKVKTIKKTASMSQHIHNSLFDCDYLMDSERYKIFAHDVRDTEGL